MIARIAGVIEYTSDSSLDIRIPSSGISMTVVVPLAAGYSIGSQVELHTYFHWSAEHGPSLYGFSTLVEKQLFTLLISAPGVGPKMAIVILESKSPAELITDITSRNAAALATVPGIGKKKAEVLLLHLAEQVEKRVDAGLLATDAPLSSASADATKALMALGYANDQARKAVAAALEDNSTATVDEIVRMALLKIVKGQV